MGVALSAGDVTYGFVEQSLNTNLMNKAVGRREKIASGLSGCGCGLVRSWLRVWSGCPWLPGPAISSKPSSGSVLGPHQENHSFSFKRPALSNVNTSAEETNYSENFQ